MNTPTSFHLRFTTLPNIFGVGLSQSEASILSSVESTRQAYEATPENNIRNLKYEICTSPVDLSSPTTGVASFDVLARAPTDRASGNIVFEAVTTETQRSCRFAGPLSGKTSFNEWDAIVEGMHGSTRQVWFEVLREQTAASEVMITRVQHKMRPKDLQPTTHGWILATSSGICMDSAYANNTTESRAIMDFYVKALCFGDWDGRILLDIKGGKIVVDVPKSKSAKP